MRKPKTGKKKAGKKTAMKKFVAVDMVKDVVKKEISRNIENKRVQFFSAGSNIYPSNSLSFLGSFIPLTPYNGFLQIDQGVGQGGRIGNKIKLKKLTIKGTIFPLPYDNPLNPNPTPIQVVLWLVTQRALPVNNPTDLTGFLQNGNGSRNLSGNLSDVISTVNEDKFMYHHRRIYKIGYAQYEGTGIQPAFQAFCNNDFKLNQNFSIDVMKYAVKDVIYDDTAGASPRTRGVFLLAQAVNADGSTMANNIIPCAMTYELNCEYEDA